MFSGGITLGAALGGNGALWVTPAQTLNALIAALVVSIISGVVPIIEAVRLPPALAFRKVVAEHDNSGSYYARSCPTRPG